MKVVPGQIKEDESIHHWYRETLKKLDRSLATEKHKRILLSMEGLRGPEHSRPSSASHSETRSTLLSQKVWKVSPQNHIIHLVFWRYGMQIGAGRGF